MLIVATSIIPPVRPSFLILTMHCDDADIQHLPNTSTFPPFVEIVTVPITLSTVFMLCARELEYSPLLVTALSATLPVCTRSSPAVQVSKVMVLTAPIYHW